jgi:VanZ family protein
MGVIFLLSSQEKFPTPPGLSPAFLAVLAHFMVFGFLSILVLFAINGLAPVTVRSMALSVVITTAYGISDEIHQAFVPGRQPSGMDVLVNFTGAVVWTAAAFLISRRVYGLRRR